MNQNTVLGEGDCVFHYLGPASTYSKISRLLEIKYKIHSVLAHQGSPPYGKEL